MKTDSEVPVDFDLERTRDPGNNRGDPAEALAALMPEAVQVVSTRDLVDAVLWPGEEKVVAGAVDKRRAEFTTARACARSALARLGIEPCEIGRGQRGEPLWPTGVVGSITHCQGHYAAAAARAEDILSLGIDAEPNAPLPTEVPSLVLNPADLRCVQRLESSDSQAGRADHAEQRVAWDRLIFSAKESIYKTWYPVIGTWLGFEEVDVAVTPDGRFSAELPRSLMPEVSRADVLRPDGSRPGGSGPDSPRPDGSGEAIVQGAVPGSVVEEGQRVTGRWMVSDGVILTAVVVFR